ncbi:hypothetical protein ACFP3I_06515 [Chryseobacterium arachidis]|uniref:hypothetical protein n=1 Tax=Chryseobacterium arachidis TaxID=1416778 RepID=UPI003606D6F5
MGFVISSPLVNWSIQFIKEPHVKKVHSFSGRPLRTGFSFQSFPTGKGFTFQSLTQSS